MVFGRLLQLVNMRGFHGFSAIFDYFSHGLFVKLSAYSISRENLLFFDSYRWKGRLIVKMGEIHST